MRIRLALLLLLIVAGYVAASAWDRCAGEECAPVCHASCLDGCATAPVPDPQEPPAAEVSRLDAVETPARLPLSRPTRPEIQPPRA